MKTVKNLKVDDVVFMQDTDYFIPVTIANISELKCSYADVAILLAKENKIIASCTARNEQTHSETTGGRRVLFNKEQALEELYTTLRSIQRNIDELSKL